MVQTDPMVDEMPSTEQPVSLQLPKLDFQIELPLAEPVNELIAAIELP